MGSALFYHLTRSGPERLLPADLSEAILRSADLSGADLRRCAFVGADLTRAILSGADLSAADLIGRLHALREPAWPNARMIGFADAILKRAFEPYVTTKPKGTGLGLPIVKKIIEEHGGSLALEDAEPFAEGARPGAMAVIRLPLTRAEAAPDADPDTDSDLNEYDQRQAV